MLPGFLTKGRYRSQWSDGRASKVTPFLPMEPTQSDYFRSALYKVGFQETHARANGLTLISQEHLRFSWAMPNHSAQGTVVPYGTQENLSPSGSKLSCIPIPITPLVNSWSDKGLCPLR